MTRSSLRLLAALALLALALGLFLTLRGPRTPVEPANPPAASASTRQPALQRDFKGAYVPPAAIRFLWDTAAPGPMAGFRFVLLTLKPTASVAIAAPYEDYDVYPCQAATVTVDSVDIVCEYPGLGDRGLGTVSVRGGFLVRELEPDSSAEVLSAVVTISTPGEIVYQARHRFHTVKPSVEPTNPPAASASTRQPALQRDFKGFYVPPAEIEFLRDTADGTPLSGFRFVDLTLQPKAFVAIAAPDEGEQMYPCRAATVTVDSVDIVCDYPGLGDRGLGTVSVRGGFLVRELEPDSSAEVLSAVVTIRTPRRTVYQARHRFHTSGSY